VALCQTLVGPLLRLNVSGQLKCQVISDAILAVLIAKAWVCQDTTIALCCSASVIDWPDPVDLHVKAIYHTPVLQSAQS
jgi:hypothetical protein